MKNVFISNDGQSTTLKKRLSALIRKAEFLKFLVGFFYFSGIQELYAPLSQNNHVELRILVGMNIDRLNKQIVEYSNHITAESVNDTVDRYLNNVRDSLKDDDFDTSEFNEQLTFFIKMIRDNRLHIRKTREPNHAKVYIAIDLDNAFRQKTFITGSSNLTRPGLTTQAEFNVELSDHGVGDIADAYFDALWEDSIKITEYEDVKNKLINLLEKETHTRQITPFEAYALTLKTYLDISSPKRNLGNSTLKAFRDNGYFEYNYQIDAIKQALTMIEQNNGVIIADVVGLGKSVIASAVAKELNTKGIIICPPGLIGDENQSSGWQMYKRQFGLDGWDIRSVGKLEETAEFLQKYGENYKAIILDEAHRFRNTDTQSYAHLSNICRGRKVMLLTATPFNNNPSDILALLRLFILPKKSNITLDDNLAARFRTYQALFNHLSYVNRYHNSPDPSKRENALKRYKRVFKDDDQIDLSKVKKRSVSLAKEIREVITPVLIRRNRLDLLGNPAYKKEISSLSKIDDPKEWFYELTKNQSELYDRIVSQYFSPKSEGGIFSGAIYQPFRYETTKDDLSEEKLTDKENFELIFQEQLASFMRRLLVKRFESSFGSFQQSLKNMKAITERMLAFIQRTGKYILDRDKINKIYELDDDEIDDILEEIANSITESELSTRNKVYVISEFDKPKAFIQDIENDIALFDKILVELEDMDLVKDDPKSKKLIEQIKLELNKKPKPGEPKRKIIIFTEYADTVTHLEHALKDDFADRMLVVRGNLSDSLIKEINQNFDASSTDQLDDYDILLSTDRISEGFNLNRAGMIINYDIPWNPVRVIQRVGRINRISRKVFDKLYIVNFFPTEVGANYVKSREIAESKMFAIHTILGEDSKIFNVDEEPTPSNLYNRLTTNVDELESMSFYTQMVQRWEKIAKAHPQLAEELNSFPTKVKVSKPGSENELFVFFRKGGFFIQKLSENETEPIMLSYEETLPSIECHFEEKRLAFSNSFWKNYKIAKEVHTGNVEDRIHHNSIEVEANNKLTFLIRQNYPMLQDYQGFMDDLLTDIREYGTLPDYTLRIIANLAYTKQKDLEKTRSIIQDLQLQIGKDFLEQQKEQLSEIKQELIIAIENQKL